MADIDSLAAALFGSKRAETQEVLTDATTRTYTGTAVTDSEDGTVIVDLGGDVTLPDDIEGLAEYSADGVEVATGPGVRAGDEVVVTLVGGTPLKTPMVTGVAGEGDAQNQRIGAIEADYVKASTLEADVADIGFLKADSATITSLQADAAKVHELTADQLSAATAYIASLNAKSVTAESLAADVAKVHDLTADQLSAAAAYIAQLAADSVTAQRIAAISGDFDAVRANAAKVANLTAAELEADHATIGSLDANYAKITNGHIDSALIDTAAIVDEQVFTVTGNKATIEEINADKITVRNLNAKNLTVETADGYVTIGDKKTPTKEYLESLKDELQQEIDGAVETFTSSAVPLLNNYPASDWIISGATEEEQRKAYAKHVGDICYVQNSALDQNGYAYRFAYDSTEQTFKWVLIKDSDVTKALGDISDLKTFESDTTTWMEETDQGLKTIRENHTALSGVVDKTVVETKQLWYTKANTTAPGKPTKEITSTSTAGNAWRVVVPAYNVSYPNYYYCLQYKLADGTYAWSDVVRDIAMGESQQQGRKGVADAATAQSTADSATTAAATADGKAVAAQSTANANIKSSVQLWFTKANTTAPSKPTAQVTVNDATKTNQWNLAIPTYSASYPNYFYCYQQQKGDGTWQWTDVVYDRSITEAQAKAQSALPSSEFNTFKTTTFKEVVDEVGEHSTSISTLTETVSTKADSSTVETLSNTVNSVKQTADTNKTSITNLTQTVNSKADSTTVTTLTNRVSTAEQNLNGITTRVGKTESAIETVSNPNLIPFFSYDLTDIYHSANNPNGYWYANSATPTKPNATWNSCWTQLEDGWVHIEESNSGSSTIGYYASGNVAADTFVESGKTYTILTEMRNCIGTPANIYASTGAADTRLPSGVNQVSNYSSGSYIHYDILTAKDATGTTPSRPFNFRIQLAAGNSFSCDVRVSLYEGEYAGPYKPYVDQTLSNRVKSAETSIEQNADAIALRATRAEVQSLGGNLLMNADNPVLGSNIAPTYSVVSGGNGTGTISTVTDSPLPDYKKSFRITGNTSGNRDFAQSVGVVYGQNYLFTAYARGIGGNATALIRVFSNAEIFTYRTVIGTDWTPIRTVVTLTSAGTGQYKYFQFGLTGAGSIEYIAPCLSGGAAANTAAELKVTNDAVSSKVSQTDYNGSTIASLINQSASTVQIQAQHIQLNGEVTFNAIKNYADAAYDALGAADEVQVGGRNLLPFSKPSAENMPKVSTANTTNTFVTEDGFACYKGTGAGTSISFYASNGKLIVPLEANTQYTYSAWIKVTTTTSTTSLPFNYTSLGHFTVRNENSTASDKTHEDVANKRIYSPSTVAIGKWTKIVLTFTTNALSGSYFGAYSKYNYGTDYTLYIRDMKLENGNKATDWTPAPEDVDTDISSAQSAANTANNKIAYYNRRCQVGQSAALNADKPWYKFASCTVNAQYQDRTLILDVFDAGGFVVNNTGSQEYGRLYAHIRTDVNLATASSLNLIWQWRNGEIDPDNFVMAYKLTSGTKVDVELWCKCPKSYSGYQFVVVHDARREELSETTYWTLYNTWANGSQAAITSGYTQVASVDASTGFITRVDDAGITVHPSGTTNNRVAINANGMQVYKNNVDVASYGDTSRIGKANSSRFLMNADSLQAYNSSNAKYFEVSASGMTYGTNTVATTDDIPTKVSELTNDSSFATTGQVTTAAGNAETAAKSYADSNFLSESDNRIWYATCDTAAATVAKVATITPTTTKFTLAVGQTVNVKFSVANSADRNSITLSVNGTTAKHIRYTASGGGVAVLPGNNYLAAGRTYQFVYDGSYWVCQMNYNSNDVDRKRLNNAVIVAENVTAYSICGRSGSGHKKLAANLAIDLTYPIAYLWAGNISGQSYAVASGGTSTAFYTSAPSVSLRNTKASWTGTQYAMCYIKGTLNGKTFTVHSDIFTTTVPTSDDGFAYIPIGMLYSTYQVDFDCDNSVYAFRNGAFQKLDSVAKYITAITDSGIRVHAKTNPTKNYAAINADGLDVVKDSVSVAQFGKTSGTGPSARIGQESKTHIVIGTTESEETTGYAGNEYTHNVASEIKLYGADGTIPNLKLYDSTVHEEVHDLNLSYDYEKVGIDFGENGCESTDNTGTSISTSVMADSANLEIQTGNTGSKRGAHTEILNTRRWASRDDYNDTTLISMNVNEGGSQPDMSLVTISGDSSARIDITATGSAGKVLVDADEILLRGIGCYMDHGVVNGSQNTATPANGTKDFTVTFRHEYASPPHVVPGFYSTSTAAGLGGLSCAVNSITTTGCTIRVFNNTSTARSPAVEWIAIG